MPPTIRVDEDVYEFLKSHAEPFVDSPNAVLRRLLDLPDSNGAGTAESLKSDAKRTRSSSENPFRKRGKPKTTTRSSRKEARKGRHRAQTGTLLPLEGYELPILQVLAKKEGGWDASSAVLDALGTRLNGKLTDVDRDRIPSGVVRWRNRAQFARLALVKKGDLAADSPRGVWEITEQGRTRVAQEK